MNSQLQRSPATHISLLTNPIRLISQSPFYKKTEQGNTALLVRGDITSINGSPVHIHSTSSAHHSILELFQTQGDSIWSSLSGAFTALIITHDQLYAYRSPFSPHLLFYHHTAISDQTLTLVEPSSHLSTDYLIRFVTDQPSLQFTSSLTPFEKIFRLPSHSTLNWVAGQSPVLQKLPFHAYEMHERQTPLEESATLIRETLSDILKRHLAKSSLIHCELSGGLDSSFIASFLSHLTSSQVKAHMFSFRQHPSHAYSESCAQLVADKKNISLTILDSAGITETSLDQPSPYQNEPVDFFWQGALFGRLCQQLVPVNSLLFTGFGCDQILMRNQDLVSYWVSRGKLLRAARLVTSIAKHLNRPALNFIYQFLLTLIPTPLLTSLLDKTKHWRLNPFKVDELCPKLSRFETIDWLKNGDEPCTPRQLLKLYEAGEVEEHRFFKSHTVYPSLNYLIAPQYVLGPYLEVKGIEYIHPFCDPRLIELVFTAIPFTQIHDFVQPYKHLLREAQRGITPEEVRTRNRDEFSFDGYFYKMLHANQDFLQTLLEEAILSYPEMIDGPKARAALQAMFFGANGNSQNKLLRLFSYLIWQRNMKAYRKEQESNPI